MVHGMEVCQVIALAAVGGARVGGRQSRTVARPAAGVVFPMARASSSSACDTHLHATYIVSSPAARCPSSVAGHRPRPCVHFRPSAGGPARGRARAGCAAGGAGRRGAGQEQLGSSAVRLFTCGGQGLCAIRSTQHQATPACWPRRRARPAPPCALPQSSPPSSPPWRRTPPGTARVGCQALLLLLLPLLLLLLRHTCCMLRAMHVPARLQPSHGWLHASLAASLPAPASPAALAGDGVFLTRLVRTAPPHDACRCSSHGGVGARAVDHHP